MPRALLVLLSIAAFSGGSSWMAACGSGQPLTPSASEPASQATASPSPGQSVASAPGSEPDAMPVLSLPSLHDGDTLQLPAELPYEIEGFPDELPEGVHLQVVLDAAGGGYAMEIPLEGPQGLLQLPSDKQLAGQRDVTFQLVDGENAPYPNPQSRLTFFSLLFTGRR